MSLKYKINPFKADYPPSILSPNKERILWPRIAAKHEYRLLLKTLTKQAMYDAGLTKKDIQQSINESLSIKKKYSSLKLDVIQICIHYVRPNNKWGVDNDNVEAAFKAGQDGIADALGINDKHISRIQTHEEFPDHKKKGFVIVSVLF